MIIRRQKSNKTLKKPINKIKSLLMALLTCKIPKHKIIHIRHFNNTTLIDSNKVIHELQSK